MIRLSAPKGVTWFLAVIVAGIGILMTLGFVSIPLLAGYVFWMEVFAFALLALAALFKGL